MMGPHPLHPLRLQPDLTAAECERRITVYLDLEKSMRESEDPIVQRLAFVWEQARKDYAEALAVLTGVTP